MSKTPFLRVAALVVLIASLSAAAVVSASATTAGGEQAKALSGSINLLVSSAQRKGWEVVIPNFRRVYPNVEVKPQYVTGGSTAQNAALLTQLQGGVGPDVFIIYPGKGVAPSVFELQKEGYLESLAGSPWVKRDPAFIRALTNVAGKPYMLELGVQMGGILYRVDQFREFGLKVPTTFNQLLGLCRTIRQKSPNTIPIAFAGSVGPLTAPVLTLFAASDVFSKDPKWNDKRIAGKTTFKQSNWRRSLQKIVDMKSAGCFNAGVAADDVPTTQAQHISGRAVMQIANTSNLGTTVVLGPNVKFDIFAVPGDTAAQTRMIVFPGSGISVNSRSPNKELAKAFVNFIARPKQNDVFAKADGYGQIAPYNFNKEDWPPFYKPLLPYAKKTITYPTYFWPTGTTFIAAGTGIQGLLTGQKTVDQVLTDMDNVWGK